jgi:hypothetical protein
MKRLILILFLLVPMTVSAISFNCKDPKPTKKYYFLDPVQGIDYVFLSVGSEIKQVGVINYFNFSITHLKSSLAVKSTETAGADSDPPDQRRIELDDMIREIWPKVDRIKYYKKK